MSGGVLTFFSLPIELHIKIFQFLRVLEVCRVSQCCRQLKTTTECETLWKYFCNSEYGISSLDAWGDNMTYRKLYSEMLHRYGSLLGLWKLEIDHYGGLLSVKIKDGMIVGERYIASIESSTSVMTPMNSCSSFNIKFDEEGNCCCSCILGYQGQHRIEFSPISQNSFQVTCLNTEYHKYPNNDLLEEFQSWLYKETGNRFFYSQHPELYQLLHIKFQTLLSFELQYHAQRLVFEPQPAFTVPIQPGLFKGTYGSHGIEVINLFYPTNSSKLWGVKIMGDPNVPAGQRSLEIHLDEPMILTHEQQLTLDDITNIHKSTIVASTASKLTEYRSGSDSSDFPPQPFHVPTDIADREFNHFEQRFGGPMTTCKARYFGTGLIAAHGFKGATRTPCHFIMFDEDTFAFLWLELYSLSYFYRAKEVPPN